MKLPTLFAGRPALSGPAAFVAAGAAVLSVVVLSGAPSAPSVTRVGGKAFNASVMDLATQGYVEEEYFIQGTARTYDIPRDQMSNGDARRCDASVQDTDRRPPADLRRQVQRHGRRRVDQRL